MDSVINIDDCGTKESIVVTSIIDGGEIIQTLTDRILGRVIAEPIFDSEGKELFPVNTMLDEDALEVIEELNLSAAANLAASCIALGRADHMHAPLLQCCQICAGCRMRPHRRIHRRGH